MAVGDEFFEWYVRELVRELPATITRRYLCADCGARAELEPGPAWPIPEPPVCCGWEMVGLLPAEFVVDGA